MLSSTVARLPEGLRWSKVLKKLLCFSVMSCRCAPVVLAACLSLGQEQVCCFSVPFWVYLFVIVLRVNRLEPRVM